MADDKKTVLEVRINVDEGNTPTTQPSSPSSSSTPSGGFQTPQGFVTSQGSHYLFEEGKSTRIKSPHAGHDPNDTGLKQTSEKTVFVASDDAKRIGMWNTLSAQQKRIVEQGNELLLTSLNAKTGKPGLDERIPIVSRVPQLGLSPVELWKPTTGPVPGSAWRSNHPGNEITDLVDPSIVTAKAEKLSEDSAAISKAAPTEPKKSFGAVLNNILLSSLDVNAQGYGKAFDSHSIDEHVQMAAAIFRNQNRDTEIPDDPKSLIDQSTLDSIEFQNKLAKLGVRNYSDLNVPKAVQDFRRSQTEPVFSNTPAAASSTGSFYTPLSKIAPEFSDASIPEPVSSQEPKAFGIVTDTPPPPPADIYTQNSAEVHSDAKALNQATEVEDVRATPVKSENVQQDKPTLDEFISSFRNEIAGLQQQAADVADATPAPSIWGRVARSIGSNTLSAVASTTTGLAGNAVGGGVLGRAVSGVTGSFFSTLASASGGGAMGGGGGLSGGIFGGGAAAAGAGGSMASVAIPVVGLVVAALAAVKSAADSMVADGIEPTTRALAKWVPVLGSVIHSMEAVDARYQRDMQTYGAVNPGLMAQQAVLGSWREINNLRRSENRDNQNPILGGTNPIAAFNQAAIGVNQAMGADRSGMNLRELLQERSQLNFRWDQATSNVESEFSKLIYTTTNGILEKVVRLLEILDPFLSAALSLLKKLVEFSSTIGYVLNPMAAAIDGIYGFLVARGWIDPAEKAKNLDLEKIISPDLRRVFYGEDEQDDEQRANRRGWNIPLMNEAGKNKNGNP